MVNMRKVRKSTKKAKGEDPIGRPKGEISPLKLMQVYQLLPKDGSPVQAKELKERASKQGISPNTLFSYLDVLERNSQVLKYADTSFKPPKVYYKLITEDEFLGKEVFKKIEGFIDRLWPMIKELDKTFAETPSKGIPDRLKTIVLEMWLAVFTAYLAVIGAKAREIEDVQRKKEFIDTATRIHLLPKLLMWSSLPWIEPKHWESALGAVGGTLQKSMRSFENEIKNILKDSGFPSQFQDLFSKFLRGLKERPSDEEIEGLMKLVEQMPKILTTKDSFKALKELVQALEKGFRTQEGKHGEPSEG
jgi:DNA-binding HxlR family transcriptional regulator